MELNKLNVKKLAKIEILFRQPTLNYGTTFYPK